MRITDTVMQKNLVYNIGSTTERLYDAETKVLTNKRINKPSDDPVDTMTSLSIRTKLSEIDQYQRNINRSQTLMTNSETVVTELNDLLDRTNTLTVQGASDNYGTQDKTSISYEVNQILEQVFNLANNRSESLYTFAGTKNDTAPYQAIRNDAGEITDVKTSGTAGDINSLVGENIKIKVNINGEDVFESGQNLFNVLINVRDNLRSNNTPALQNNLVELNNASEKVVNIQSIIGSRVNRIDAAQSRAENDTVSFTEYLSKTEDIDASQAIMDYQQQLVTLQSSLQAGARIMTPKLADFLH